MSDLLNASTGLASIGARTQVRSEEVTTDAAGQIRRPLSGIRADDIVRIVGAALAAVAITYWLTTQVLPIDSPVGFVAIAYLLFVGLYAVMVSLDADRVTVQDRIIAVVIHSAAVTLLLALILVVVFALIRGSAAFSQWNFWVQDLSLAGPLDPLSVGGMAHAAVGTFDHDRDRVGDLHPVGPARCSLHGGVSSRFTRVLRTVVEAMTALPSIICGLFILATYVLMFGLDKSGFAAALAVTIMILPIIIRSADVVLRLVPATLKEAALATGASRLRTVWHVTLPTARSGLMTAVVLGTARGIGETSPVLLTAGYTTFFNLNPFSGPMTSLPFATFTLVKSPEPTQIARGFGAAAVLMVLVFVLFMLARLLGDADQASSPSGA